MELRIPSVEQLRTIYDRDLKEAFPTAELKPLRNIEKSWAEGWYKPYCLFDGDNIVGEAFLWLGHPGWALLDYLCVSSIRRNGGVGASILEKQKLLENARFCSLSLSEYLRRLGLGKEVKAAITERDYRLFRMLNGLKAELPQLQKEEILSRLEAVLNELK